MLGELKERLFEERTITLSLDESASELLIEKGYDPRYGARPMRRALERLIENPISELILQGEFEQGAPVIATADGEEMRFTRGD